MTYCTWCQQHYFTIYHSCEKRRIWLREKGFIGFNKPVIVKKLKKMVHCAECGTKENVQYYGGRHLCVSCRNMINGKKKVQIPKTESDAKTMLQLSYLLGDKRK